MDVDLIYKQKTPGDRGLKTASTITIFFTELYWILFVVCSFNFLKAFFAEILSGFKSKDLT